MRLLPSTLFLSLFLAASLLLLQLRPASAEDGVFRGSIDDEVSENFDERLIVRVPHPTDIHFTPDDRYAFITSKMGMIWRVAVSDMDDVESDSDADDLEPQLIFEIPYPMCLNGARGLSSILIHPNYPATPWIYVFHNYDKYGDCAASMDPDEGPVNMMSRWTLTGSDLDEVDPDSEKVFLTTRRLNTQTHNSGDMAWGKDGYLYVMVGEGGTKKLKNTDGVLYPQANDVMLGVIVRVTDDNEIPDTNPYTPTMGDSKAVRCNVEGQSFSAKKRCQEVYATGLRNPYRMSMDPNADGTSFYINNVGDATWEMIFPGGDDYVGVNYGYPIREGPCLKDTKSNCKPDSDYQSPIHWYRHTTEHGGAVTGSAFVPNDANWPASTQGGYMYSDHANGGIYLSTKKENSGCSYPECDPPVSDYFNQERLWSKVINVMNLQFGPHKNGKSLYYLTHWPGKVGGGGREAVYRIAFTGESNRDPVAQIEATNTIGFLPLAVSFDASLSSDPDGDLDLTYEWDFNGDGNVDSTDLNPTFTYTTAGIFKARLSVFDGRGGSASTTVRVDVDNSPPIPKINSPGPSTTFAVGDAIVLKGSAYDAEDGDLDGMALTWEVRESHHDHFHAFLEDTRGEEVEIVIPAPEDFEPDPDRTTYLEIFLTATDSAGLSMTTSTILRPKLVELEVETTPPGLTIIANGDTYATPAKLLTIENHKIKFEANDDQTLDNGNGDVSYNWSLWSTGGEQSHDYVASSSKSGYILATFEGPPPTPAPTATVTESYSTDEDTATDTDVDATTTKDEMTDADTTDEDSEAGKVILELDDFKVKVDVEKTSRRDERRLRSTAVDRALRDFDKALVMKVAESMHTKYVERVNGKRSAKLHRIHLSKKDEWTTNNDDSTYPTYRTVYGGVLVVKKERGGGQDLPTKDFLQSIQAAALNEVNRGVLTSMREEEDYSSIEYANNDGSDDLGRCDVGQKCGAYGLFNAIDPNSRSQCPGKCCLDGIVVEGEQDQWYYCCAGVADMVDDYFAVESTVRESCSVYGLEDADAVDIQDADAASRNRAHVIAVSTELIAADDVAAAAGVEASNSEQQETGQRVGGVAALAFIVFGAFCLVAVAVVLAVRHRRSRKGGVELIEHDHENDTSFQKDDKASNADTSMESPPRTPYKSSPADDQGKAEESAGGAGGAGVYDSIVKVLQLDAAADEASGDPLLEETGDLSHSALDLTPFDESDSVVQISNDVAGTRTENSGNEDVYLI